VVRAGKRRIVVALILGGGPVYRARDRQAVIAGYHWFSDWGRHDDRSAGLTLATNRPEIAKSILLEFSNTSRRNAPKPLSRRR